MKTIVSVFNQVEIWNCIRFSIEIPKRNSSIFLNWKSTDTIRFRKWKTPQFPGISVIFTNFRNVSKLQASKRLYVGKLTYVLGKTVYLCVDNARQTKKCLITVGLKNCMELSNSTPAFALNFILENTVCITISCTCLWGNCIIV